MCDIGNLMRLMADIWEMWKFEALNDFTWWLKWAASLWIERGFLSKSKGVLNENWREMWFERLKPEIISAVVWRHENKNWADFGLKSRLKECKFGLYGGDIGEKLDFYYKKNWIFIAKKWKMEFYTKTRINQVLQHENPDNWQEIAQNNGY